MEKRKELYLKAEGIKLVVQALAATIQNPTEELTWKEVEGLREEIHKMGRTLLAYSEEVDDYICNNTPIWAEQMDKAFELFAPYNDPDNKYNPDDIVIEDLKAEFMEHGLEAELAEHMAASAKYPPQD